MTLTDENRPFIRMLLPFWVNGTLRAYDATVVQSALAIDADLRAEVEALKALREGMHALPVEQSPGEFGLARLQRSIAAETATPRRSFGPLAAVAAAAVVAAFGTYILAPAPEAPGGLFQQASGPALRGALTVSFRDNVTEAELTRVLLAQDLVIVDGPSALGFYRLQPAANADVAAVVSALRAETDVIGSVEPAE